MHGDWFKEVKLSELKDDDIIVVPVVTDYGSAKKTEPLRLTVKEYRMAVLDNIYVQRGGSDEDYYFVVER